MVAAKSGDTIIPITKPWAENGAMVGTAFIPDANSPPQTCRSFFSLCSQSPTLMDTN
jgi:hypothetical protein